MEFEIFSDETHITDKNGKKYLGIGCLFIPVSYKHTLSKKLSDLRCLNEDFRTWTWNYDECKHPCKEKYHNLNNFEIHSTEIENNIEDKDKLLYFSILYLDLDKLDFDKFGVNKDTTNIYNRFFRTVILSAKSFYFKDIDFTIKNIFHDIADEKQVHDYFDWHTLYYLKNKRINIKTDKIEFINSNHKYYGNFEQKENAQFIQLIDLILGCSNQILFETSKNRNKIKIASDFYPLFKRLWNKPYNFNSSFNYVRSQQVSIFPKTSIKSQIDFEGSYKDVNQFHNDLEITDPESLIEQSSLDNWF